MSDEATAISLLRELSCACANGSKEQIEEAVNKAVIWYRELLPLKFHAQRRTVTRCQANSDGDCYSEKCPQLRDGEPAKTGRHCPYDTKESEDE